MKLISLCLTSDGAVCAAAALEEAARRNGRQWNTLRPRSRVMFWLPTALRPSSCVGTRRPSFRLDPHVADADARQSLVNSTDHNLHRARDGACGARRRTICGAAQVSVITAAPRPPRRPAPATHTPPPSPTRLITTDIFQTAVPFGPTDTLTARR
ncbi:hypothetical protein EVAR_63759_1 [Eumeta japonica]|uniref:Uncharacterized protein n=1 Tax=Eumeta variegata TaxID=151549 RepID=A0A4C1ZRB9_EUMVA|nr:hypothetical protein EVAR_63759_1 [Eumeta japonica]